ncbi:MAG: ribonuclease Z [Candidatus Woesearchaeota archaeon]|nr:ribonuclease Z [Candidatus Woesearchaeota archaeon]
MAEIVFLGTSSMVPTKERNHSAIFFSHNSEGILFDCGEGTQRQLKIAGINPNRINKILLSHWHGDHVLGLPGLLQTLASNGYDSKLQIFGPKGTKSNIKHLFKAFYFLNKLDLEIIEVKKKKFFENSEYSLEAYSLEHKVPCLGFRFVEKDKRKVEMAKAKKLGLSEGPLIGEIQEGKTIVFNGKKITPSMITYMQKGIIIGYISDTNKCNSCLSIARDADVLISEATFGIGFDEKAEEYTHMTAKDAGMIASGGNAKKLILTHFSQRYKSTDEILEEAQNYFANTICAYDFMKVTV